MMGEPFHSGDFPDEPAALDEARAAHWHRTVAAIPLHPGVPLTARRHPYLIELQGPHDPWLLQTFDAAQSEREASQAEGLKGTGASPHRIGGWLQSSAYADQVAITLAALHRIPAAAITGETYFRISDRRVLCLLRHAVGDSRVASAFGQLKSWTFLDMRGQLATLARSSGDRINVPDRLALSREEWAVLRSGEAVNRALAVALGTEPGAGSDISHISIDDLYAAAFKAIALARSAQTRWPHRLTDPGDETLWSAHCLLYPGLLRAVPSGIKALDELMALTEAAEPVRFISPKIMATLQEASRAVAALPLGS